MTKPEMNKLLALLQVNYSYAFKNMSQNDKYLLLETWTFTLQDLDAHVVFMAVMQLISVSKWLPTVAEVREECRNLYYQAHSVRANWLYDEMSEEKKRVYQAIEGATHHLRGEGPPKLTLETILERNGNTLNGGPIARMIDDPEERQKHKTISFDGEEVRDCV